MTQNEIFSQTMTAAANNPAVALNDEREAWPMWDPAIPSDLYQQMLAA